MTKIAKVIAGYVIKKELVSTPLAHSLSRVTASSDGFKPQATIGLQENPIESMKIVRRQAQHQYSSSRQTEAFFLINMLPYMQGFLLYVLSVTYPFFCVMLLMPGQAGSFLTWLTLWAWVKSWDVGFAFVMVADEILWELMPQTAFIDAEKAQDYVNPVNILQTVFEGDISYNASTYWLLLAGMIGAVPIVTANIFLGAKKAVAGVMLKGISEVTDVMGAGTADYVAGRQVMTYAKLRGMKAAELQNADSGAQLAQDTQANKSLAARQSPSNPAAATATVAEGDKSKQEGAELSATLQNLKARRAEVQQGE
jgi:hypothetical protein